MSESDKYQWGIIFILYLVPSAIWILWLLGEAQRENKRAEALLAVVMVALIALYQAEFPPGFGAILLMGCALFLVAAQVYKHRAKLFRGVATRAVVSIVGIWWLSLFAWYVTFSDDSFMRDHPYISMAIFAPLISSAVFFAFSWLRAPRRE